MGPNLEQVIARARLETTDSSAREHLTFLAHIAQHSDSTQLEFRSELELRTRAIKGGVTVCTAHKSKRLEARRVFVVNRSDLEPGTLRPNASERVQPENLRHVALTRAKHVLYFVTVPPAAGR